MKRSTKQYLEYVKWPVADKRLCEAAFAPAKDVFDDAGPGAHLADRSIAQLRYTYGKFLFFLAAERAELLESTPVDRVTAKTIEAFVKWQPASCGAVTVSIYLYHLWIALKCLCPQKEWLWLLGLSKRVKARGKAKPERHHLITSEILYALGIELMEWAQSCGKLATSGRIQAAFRDGLIIALLAAVPLRRRTLEALRVGKSLLRSGSQWELEIPAGDVKTRRSLDYSLSPELSRWIDLYVNEIRARTPSASGHDFLWVSSRGRRFRGGSIYNAVRRRTRKAFGFPVNLHRFRSAAGTFWSVRDPKNVCGVKDLLGHADFRTTEKYYIMAQSRVAGRTLSRIVDGLRNDRTGQAGRLAAVRADGSDRRCGSARG